ncbi:MAG: PIG-L family deacetylase [Chloroflexi bacterium]|nr:PIG-L family deacetylase [Chloroflexota bacterium]
MRAAPADEPLSDESPTDYLPALGSPAQAVLAAPVVPDRVFEEVPAAEDRPADATLPSVNRADASLGTATLASVLLGGTAAHDSRPIEGGSRGPKLGVAKPVFGQADLPSWMQGTVVIIAPHYDDEVLGCGGLIARLEGKARVHVVFVTDSSQGPIPLSNRQGKPDPHLSAIRRTESMAALRLLGVPEEHLHFLNLPEKHLDHHLPAMRSAFSALLAQLQPDAVLVPFRYDRHPQHLRVRDEAVRALYHLRSPAQLLEYFINFRWPLMGNSDVRPFLRERYLLRLDVAAALERKRAALACFASQVTRFYSWQERPALSKAFLDDFCQPTEIFLHAPAAAPLKSIFKRYRWLIRLAYQADLVHTPLRPMQERLLARLKDLTTAPTWSPDPAATQPHRPG